MTPVSTGPWDGFGCVFPRQPLKCACFLKKINSLKDRSHFGFGVFPHFLVGFGPERGEERIKVRQFEVPQSLSNRPSSYPHLTLTTMVRGTGIELIHRFSAIPDIIFFILRKIQAKAWWWQEL